MLPANYQQMILTFASVDIKKQSHFPHFGQTCLEDIMAFLHYVIDTKTLV